MKVFDEFKAFALTGSVVDLAVGVIIGTAFNQVVSSLVNDVLMPPIGLLIAGVNFNDIIVPISLPWLSNDPVSWKIGSFFSKVLDFFIISWTVFWVVKIMNRLQRSKEQNEPKEKTCPKCMMSIPKHAVKCGFCTSDQIS